LSEETKQINTLRNGIERAKAKCFFSGVLVGIFLMVATAFAIDPYLRVDYAETTNQEFGLNENYEEFDKSDYPAWMDQIVDPPAGIKPSDVYTFSCELVLRKPTAFSTTCADFGVAIFEVKWSMWSADGARGRGIYSVNDCNPSCAEGTRHEIPVYLWLKNASTDGKFYFLNTLQIVPKDVYEGRVDEIRSNHASLSSSVIIEGRTLIGAEWEVSSDWKDFPELRGELPK
jgi:hypothetical protein